MLVFILLLFQSLAPQWIHGQILDANKNPLSGVSIRINQHKIISDSEGHFSLNTNSNKGKYTFSAIGYISQTQYLEPSQNEVKIVLMEQIPEIRQQP